MFGYIVPDKPNMFIKDFSLYKAYYCGLCKSIGKQFGNVLRLSTNYDMTFFAIFVDALIDGRPTFTAEGCILNPVKKKSIAKESETLDRIARINMLLAYYKIQDDIRDGNEFKKKLANKMYVERVYKKIKKVEDSADEIMQKGFLELQELEEKKEASVDRIAHPFAQMLSDLLGLFIENKPSNEAKSIMYTIGKLVYLIDAIDDIESDYKNNNYNVFLQNYNFEGTEKFLQDKQEELKFILMSCYDSIKCDYNNIIIKENEGVLTNIFWYGILFVIDNVLKGNKEWKKTRI